MSSMNFGMWTFEIALSEWARKDEALWRKGERNSVVEASGSRMNVGSVDEGAKSAETKKVRFGQHVICARGDETLATTSDKLQGHGQSGPERGRSTPKRLSLDPNSRRDVRRAQTTVTCSCRAPQQRAITDEIGSQAGQTARSRAGGELLSTPFHLASAAF